MKQSLGDAVPDGILLPARTQNVWLFQANPRVYDFAQALREIDVGDEDDWTVTRYRKDMRPGDTVLIWQGGTNAGIYAVGEVTQAPEERDPPAFLPQHRSDSKTGWRVRFRYTRILQPPLPKAQLLAHPILRNMQVLRAPQGTNFQVTAEEWEALRDLIDDAAAPTQPTLGELIDEETVPTRPTLDELMEKTHLACEDLEDLESILEEKRHVILEGPPGSGKTYIGELFARYFTGNPLHGDPDERLVLVQFHQTYSYEDFIQGIRPETNTNGQLGYRVRDGIFKHLCATAERNLQNKFVIVIDEINRGNISRIFGELLLLLEYRDKHVRLPYSGPDDPPFSIPPNVYIIGTMNTADRSLAQIDYALRRRFYFYRMQPVVDGTAPVLERWLETKDIAVDERARVLHLFLRLNERVQQELGEGFQVGHSYFMTHDIGTAEGQQRVWRRAILPLLDEYFYNRRNRAELMADFAIERLLGDGP